MFLGRKKQRAKFCVLGFGQLHRSAGLYRIIQPFANEAVGAVAGHTHDDRRAKKTLFPKMESVRYFVSQRVMKAL